MAESQGSGFGAWHQPANTALAVERGEILGEHPLDDGPWIINRQSLETPTAAQVVQRVKGRIQTPAKPNSQSQTLAFSDT